MHADAHEASRVPALSLVVEQDENVPVAAVHR